MLQSLRGHHSAKQLTNLKNVSEGGGRRFLWLCCQISGLQEYTDAENEKQRPIMIHRAVFGSIERFFGILVENFAGAFPLWLAPVQVGNPPPPPPCVFNRFLVLHSLSKRSKRLQPCPYPRFHTTVQHSRGWRWVRNFLSSVRSDLRDAEMCLVYRSCNELQCSHIVLCRHAS